LLTGKTFTHYGEVSGSTDDVQARILDDEVTQPDQRRLGLAGMQLEDERTSSAYNVRKEPMLHLVLRPRAGIQYVVTTICGKIVTLDVGVFDAIDSVKARIRDEEGFMTDPVTTEVVVDPAITTMAVLVTMPAPATVVVAAPAVMTRAALVTMVALTMTLTSEVVSASLIRTIDALVTMAALVTTPMSDVAAPAIRTFAALVTMAVLTRTLTSEVFAAPAIRTIAALVTMAVLTRTLTSEVVAAPAIRTIAALVTMAPLTTTLTSEVVAVPATSTLHLALRPKEGIPPDHQRLIFAGMRLEDGRTVADCNMQIESMMFLMLRLRGGMQLSQKMHHDGTPPVRQCPDGIPEPHQR